MQFQRRRPARNKVIQCKSINNDFLLQKISFRFQFNSTRIAEQTLCSHAKRTVDKNRCEECMSCKHDVFTMRNKSSLENYNIQRYCLVLKRKIWYKIKSVLLFTTRLFYKTRDIIMDLCIFTSQTALSRRYWK